MAGPAERDEGGLPAVPPMTDPGPARRGRLLLFVHVPKTAGTTLRAILNMAEPDGRSRALGNVFKGGGGVDKGAMSRLRRPDGLDLTGVGLVRGHVPLGIREYLPQHLPKQRNLHCFTFLREPADRTLSHYFQIRENGAKPGASTKLALSRLPPDPTLEDMLEAGYIHDNLHTRMLCGNPEPFGEVTEEMLEEAKRNLREELVFFGLTERFDESLVLAKRRLGFRAILYRSDARVNTGRPRGDTVARGLVEAAKCCNRYDTELYSYAKELFENAPEREELEFQVELEALRAARPEGELDLGRPAPAGFPGDEESWRMALAGWATSHRLEFEIARSRFRHARERAKTRRLERTIQRWAADPPSMEKLEQEVERLKSASSRAKELEREVERLKAGASSPQAQSDGRSGSRRRRQRPRDRPKRASDRPARSRSRRNVKRTGSRAAGERPRREARRRGSKRGSERTAQPRPDSDAEETASDG
jgi:hypothetical protein